MSPGECTQLAAHGVLTTVTMLKGVDKQKSFIDDDCEAEN